MRSSGARSTLERDRRRLFLPFVLPALVLYLVFFIGPALAAVWISFTRWNGSTDAEWVGTRNYEVLVDDPVFHTAFVNTLLILVVVGVVVFVIAFGLTMVLREMRGRNAVRSILFTPYMVSAIVLSILWGFIFQYDGLVNSLLEAFGMEPVKWLSAGNLMPMILLGMVWINVGLYAMIILAAVDRIPNQYYEDAALAGTNSLQRFFYVTLPMTWDVVAVAATLWTINSLKIFEFIFAFGGTTTDLPSTDVWNSALFVYGMSFGGRTPAYAFGYASAAAVLMLILFAVFVILLRRIMRREPIEF
ncbi:sugar ABC transporter permease [Nocardioides sp. YIM 152315]|nr:sugar ABC transporter permease [Nocardioides sp. YIM 152315]